MGLARHVYTERHTTGKMAITPSNVMSIRILRSYQHLKPVLIVAPAAQHLVVVLGQYD